MLHDGVPLYTTTIIGWEFVRFKQKYKLINWRYCSPISHLPFVLFWPCRLYKLSDRLCNHCKHVCWHTLVNHIKQYGFDCLSLKFPMMMEWLSNLILIMEGPTSWVLLFVWNSDINQGQCASTELKHKPARLCKLQGVWRGSKWLKIPMHTQRKRDFRT